MGLPARQEKVLEHIETELRASDPKLVGLYVTFARLADDEEMPRIEQVRHRVSYLLAGLARSAGRILATLRHPRARRKRSAVLFFPLALAVITTSITFAVRSSTTPAAATVRSVAAVRSQPKTSLATPSHAFYTAR